MFTQQQLQPTPEAQLLQYQVNSQHQAHSFREVQQLPNGGHHHTQSASFPTQQSMSFSHDSPYVQAQDGGYAHHARMGSVPVQSGAEMGDDKRRRGLTAAATNDKELREMLARNENRPLRDVAQEVIQKERTPMAEKTKQLFAMLWWVSKSTYSVRMY